MVERPLPDAEVKSSDKETEEVELNVNDTQAYYLIGNGDGLPERVDCDQLPDSLGKGKQYATAEQINAYQADEDTDKDGVDLTPSVVPSQAVS